MSIFSGLFKKKRPNKRIAAFVDYEHWFYSMSNIHHMKPDVQGWFDELAQYGRVTDCTFFGDFSQPGLRDEIGTLRATSSQIIETSSPSSKHEKDYTDFIMLDSIYKRAFNGKDVDLFIIFSGDGHFSSAVTFLKNYVGKEVGVYGVKGATSRQIKESADWWVETPDEKSKQTRITAMILSSIKNAQRGRNSFITFTSTVERVAGMNSLDKEDVKTELSRLINSGLIEQQDIQLRKGLRLRTLKPDWQAIEKAGMFGSDR